MDNSWHDILALHRYRPAIESAGILLLHERSQGFALISHCAVFGLHSRVHHLDGMDNFRRRDQSWRLLRNNPNNIGAYFLNLSKTSYRLLPPLMAIFKEPGSRLMLLVSFLYAFTSTIGELSIIHNPYFSGILCTMALAVLLTLFLSATAIAEPGKNLMRKPLMGMILGVLVATTIFSHICDECRLHDIAETHQCFIQRAVWCAVVQRGKNYGEADRGHHHNQRRFIDRPVWINSGY